MKTKALKALFIAAGLSLLASGSAFALTDPYSYLSGGSYRMKYSNWEQLGGDLVNSSGYANFTPGSYSNTGEDLRGLVQVTQIFNPSSNTTPAWQDGVGGAHIWGVFYGFSVNTVTASDAHFSGGVIELYTLAANINPFTTGTGQWTGGVGGATYQSINDLNSDGSRDVTPWLTARFASGVDPLNALTTLAARIDNSVVPINGTGQSYFNVVEAGDTVPVGLHNGTSGTQFNTNSIATVFGLRDAILANRFNTPVDLDGDGFDDNSGIACVPGAGLACQLFQGNWHFVSEDPVRGVIPEPGSMFLLGAGLLGFALSRRKQRS